MRKSKVKNKYNLKISDIKNLKINDRSKICEPLFWRNDVVKAWCVSENTIKNSYDREYSNYHDYWIGIFDEASKRNQKIEVICNAFKGTAVFTYNFKKFFEYEEIENEDALEIQEKLLKKINQLIDEKVLILP